jgi:cytochrome c biogenesis protein CcdA
MSNQQLREDAARPDQVRVFRTTFGMVSGLVVSLMFLVPGVCGLAPPTHAGISGMIVAGLLAAFGLWLFARSVLVTRLIVTPASITYRRRLRKHTVPWPYVQSFDVGISRSLVHWPSLLIVTQSGLIRVDTIAGSRAFAEKLVRELRGIQSSRTA